jgi:hypothetical protein
MKYMKKAEEIVDGINGVWGIPKFGLGFHFMSSCFHVFLLKRIVLRLEHFCNQGGSLGVIIL